jgi:signal transduction histidine kinase
MTLVRDRAGRFVFVTAWTRQLSARFRAAEPAQIDRLAGVLLLVAIELQVWTNPSVQHRLPAALGGLVLAAAVALRRRWPLALVGVAFVAVAVQDGFGGRVTEHAVGALAALALLFYAAGAFLPSRRGWLALALGLAGLVVHGWVAAESFLSLPFAALFLLLLPWATGRTLRGHRSREHAYRGTAERLDAEREQRAAAAAFSERARIARELHDVIAHSVSVMVVQAGAARTVMDRDVEQAERSLRAVERAGREALAEIRRLLGLLDGDRDPGALTPQPGLADLQGLLARTRAAGLATELHVAGTPTALSPALDLCAYRIVQEALTNAIKHAGSAQATVYLHWTANQLELEVSDDGRGPRTVNGSRSGHGIVGMRERAALHGGSIHTGAGADRGFTVRAELPLQFGLA